MKVKQYLHFILYAIAIVIVLIPIVCEQMGSPLGQGQTVLLSAGLLVAMAGKVVAIKKKRAAGETAVFLDAVIILCLAVMLVWMIVRGR